MTLDFANGTIRIWRRFWLGAEMKATAVVCGALLLASAVGRSQDAAMEHRVFQVGEVNYFGYGGLPLERVKAAMPLHVGDTLSQAGFSKEPIEDAIAGAIGKSPTDVNVTCCDAAGKLEIFVGLPGLTSRVVPEEEMPTGKARLDAEGMRLVDQDLSLIADAVGRGGAGEDDSQGYMLSSDPKARAVNEAMRTYAVGHEEELQKVLATSSEVKDRRAAAILMGYSKRSPKQAEALQEAMRDPDDAVRNNAVRSLAVLAAATSGPHVQVDFGPLIDLLYSGVWTDRNKVSLLLMRMTATRNQDVLRALRKDAMGPLVEGAMWKDVPGHSTPSAVVLGRIGGLTNEEIAALLKSGNAQAIVAAARATKD